MDGSQAFGGSLRLILHQVDQFCVVGQLPHLLSCVQYRDAALGCIARWRMGGFRPDIGPNELPVGVHPPPTQCLLPPCFVIYCTHPVCVQVHKPTSSEIHKFTNTQMHQYKYTLPYLLLPCFVIYCTHPCTALQCRIRPRVTERRI